MSAPKRNLPPETVTDVYGRIKSSGQKLIYRHEQIKLIKIRIKKKKKKYKMSIYRACNKRVGYQTFLSMDTDGIV